MFLESTTAPPPPQTTCSGGRPIAPTAMWEWATGRFESPAATDNSTFMASTTLTRPLQTLSRLCNSLKASSGTPTGYISTPTGSTALLWPLLQPHGLSCEILPTILQNIYIFTARIVQKNFLKAMRGLLEAMRVLLEAVIVLLEAVRVLVEAIRVLVNPVRVPAEAWRLLQRHESVLFAGALLMSTKSKRKHKLSDIESKDRNETKMF